MKINEVAKLTGVTVRTLHYYDEIGLLKPSEITESGYRLYDENALEQLQQILFFRELEFSLADIKKILTNPHYSKSVTLKKQKELLIQKRNRLNGLIKLIENTIKGDTAMSFQEFDQTEIEAARKKYANEVQQRWGNTDAYWESKEKAAGYDAQQWQAFSSESREILRAFAQNRNLAPDSETAQALVQKWQDYITAHFYKCSNEILSCLGVMYSSDERFTQNIDQYGKGTAAFMTNAIAVYCAK